MTHPLRDVVAKLARADEHLGLINERMDEFINGESYRVDTEQDRQTDEVVLYVEVLGPVPIEEWGAVIGDSTHNLRSTLDHLVWQLGLLNPTVGPPPPDPIPWSSPWKRVGFPIVVDEINWPKQAREKLACVRPE